MQVKAYEFLLLTANSPIDSSSWDLLDIACQSRLIFRGNNLVRKALNVNPKLWKGYEHSVKSDALFMKIIGEEKNAKSEK